MNNPLRKTACLRAKPVGHLSCGLHPQQSRSLNSKHFGVLSGRSRGCLSLLSFTPLLHLSLYGNKRDVRDWEGKPERKRTGNLSGVCLKWQVSRIVVLGLREREMLLVLTVERRRGNPKGTTSCSPDHGKSTHQEKHRPQIVNMTPLEWWCLWTLTTALELARRSTLVVLELCPRTYDGVLPNPCLLIS
ncbi:hypothetical protein NC653_011942 [Populus alba x Populus x berolinensis]|uniref:Uncharacterized protein n=2 Tax=Populus alba x Populus x berolinensis TaxID=444605 RepID=A0AAD6R3I1_9ROSI|nr:hypothetical protein NC653_011942 [Populus alba x Populus x berolinensis]